MKMFAYVTRSGTAIAETAICSNHIDSPAAEALAWGTAHQFFQEEPDPWNGNEEISDCTGNEELHCQVCGAPHEITSVSQILFDMDADATLTCTCGAWGNAEEMLDHITANHQEE